MAGENFETAHFSGENLACRRGGRLVFTGLRFAVAPGEALVLRGPNGSGKTTLLRLMAGLTPPSGGHLMWAGEIVDDHETLAAHLRFIGHLDAIKPAFTVRENLAFWSAYWGAGDSPQIDAALDAFGLAPLSAFPARLLSAGQRHRLALARLLAAPAPLWLLDEPANALDDRSTAALTRAIADHRQKGGMVVLASHGADLAQDAGTLMVDAFTPALGTGHWTDTADAEGVS